MKKNIETRQFKTKELRSWKTDDGQNVLEGYSVVFDSLSEDFGWGDHEVREKIAAGAFTEALKSSDCRALFNHKSDFVLGRESAGTLELTEDDTGLKSVIYLPDTQIARDLAVSIERGDIKEQSFSFIVEQDTWEDDREKKVSTRTIHKIKELIDISIVTYPAYTDTSVAKRSYEAAESGFFNIESETQAINNTEMTILTRNLK